MRVRSWSAAALAAVGVLAGCGGAASDDDRQPTLVNEVATAFYPTTYFAERIAGGLVAVRCPLPDGADPIFWTPDAQAVAVFQNARLVALNGAEFERWAVTAPLARSRVVETASALSEPLITIEGVTHSHGPGGEHSHDGVDGHTWVDPINAATQAAALAERMALAWPEHAEAMRTNARALDEDLRALHARLTAIDVSGATLLSSHPAYNYLARRLGWTVRGFDLDPRAPLSDGQAGELGETLAGIDPASRVVVMLWESEPLDNVASRLREQFGVTSAVFSPAESLDADRRAAGETYLTIMNDNIDRLEKALNATP